ncbi:MAG: glycosyltransferase [Candidatus Moranbacteria bacterium]|nr:glycosyltransferase [Candidatus Moranbacteria bacterium]
MNEKNSQKIALVHDFLTSYGGAERVLQSMRKLYPEAPVFTLLASDSIVQKHFSGAEVRTSWLAKLPGFLRRHPKLLLLLYPAAMESFDLREYDLVISSSGAWSKGLVTRLHTRHVAYLHSPMRFAWDKHREYLKDLNLSFFFRILGRFTLSYLRIWDFQAADRPDVLLANSRFTQKRIAKYYRKESQVVYPGVFMRESPELTDTERKYFLVVSRLTKAKKIHLAIEAANKLGLELKIVGTGKEEKALRGIASRAVSFLGQVSDEELVTLYQGARALIIPSEEDFGMVAVEALLHGTPVIAYGAGGAQEIVTDGVHGLFFREPMAEILAEALMRFREQEKNFDRKLLQLRAQEFSEQQFLESLKQALVE